MEYLLGFFVCMYVTNASRVSRKKYCRDILVGIKMTEILFRFSPFFNVLKRKLKKRKINEIKL